MVVNCPDCKDGEIFFLNHAAQPCENCFSFALVGVSDIELESEARRLYDAFREHQKAVPAHYLPKWSDYDVEDQRMWLNMAAENLSD